MTIPLAVIFTISALTVNAKISIGRLQSSENFAYLDRFCFVSDVGHLKYQLTYPKELEVQSFLMYYDSDRQWAAAYKSELTCDQKVGFVDPNNYQEVKLSPILAADDIGTSCKTLEDTNGEMWYQCTGNRRFISPRARWWFLAISNCHPVNGNDTEGVYVEYELTMTNGDPGDIWFYHFSADEFYILPVDILFLLVEGLLLLLAITVAFVLKSRNLLHQTFKLYLQAVVLECLSLFCMCAAYGRAASTTLFIFLLLLIAKGYTITRGRLSSSATWKLAVVLMCYIICYVAMFVWQLKVFDPARVTYVSESLPAYLLAAQRIIIWCSYCLSSYITVTKYPLKKNYYLVMGFLMTIWFWAGPIVLCFANFVLDDWVREEVVNAVDNCVVLYGFIVFMVLTWPSAANRNFPYHMRTTQIGDTNQPADFPQNAYEVRYTNGADETVDNGESSHSRESTKNNTSGNSNGYPDVIPRRT